MNMIICCYDLVGVDSKTLVPFVLFYFTLCCFSFYKKSNDLINLVINLFLRTQFPVGSTSHLQNPLLQTIRALASTIKIHIIQHATKLFSDVL
jgi:hypothetical protein